MTEIGISSNDTALTVHPFRPSMCALERGYPTADALLSAVETVTGGDVRAAETGYGYSCHVTDVESTAGTSFVAIDADRTVPEVYFDAAAARGRRVVTDAQRGASFAYVIESLLGDGGLVDDFVSTHQGRYAAPMVADGGTRADGEASGMPVPTHSSALESWLREEFHDRCQYLHARRASRNGGPLTAMLDAFDRDPLTNDKLGQQFGWRIASPRADRWPDPAIDLVVFASFRQVRDALQG